MIDRRRFIQALAVAAATPAVSCASARTAAFGELKADRARILDLPPGFQYRVIARAGDEMDDGLLVPGLADGMAAFPGVDGRINLVCNHENGPTEQHLSAFGRQQERLHLISLDLMYDTGSSTPGAGGTTNIVYNAATGEKESQYLSLAGTEFNCCGGPTPWGSWLSCEEAFSEPGPAFELGMIVERNKRHGYIFEVPSSSTGLVDPVPLKEMGRFEHEAAAVDPASGVVYLTEDRHRSLLYRYVPNEPGKLVRGGQLQALAIVGKDSFDTRNWGAVRDLQVNQWLETRWVDIENADADKNDLRFQGFENGAARFARGEGLCYAEGSVFVTCTIGGPARLGQVFEYRVSPREGTAEEIGSPGRLRLIAESEPGSVLHNADNITMSPWGDLIVCEDTADHNGLVGLTPEGTLYPLADNAYSTSELAGVCFAPDGKTMFVNIQEPGTTLAITGPW